MFVRSYRLAWLRGFVDGERGNKHQTFKGIPGFRYTNGWIEGHAKRQGFAYGLSDVTQEELDNAREKAPPQEIHAWDNMNWTF
jgi:hypothetical protein